MRRPPGPQGRSLQCREVSSFHDGGRACRADSPIAFNVILGTKLTDALKALGSPLFFGLRLWVSVCLALYLAFWLELDNPDWAGVTAAFVCQPHLGASLRKGWYRMIGTVVGGMAIVVLTACFPQDRVAFLVGLALWGAGCAFVATILRNSSLAGPCGAACRDHGGNHREQ